MISCLKYLITISNLNYFFNWSLNLKFIRRLPIRMSNNNLDLQTGQSQSPNVIDSSDSSQEKKEILNKLQSKVTNLLIVQKKSEKLSKSQDNLKKCLDKIEQYKKINQELQQRQNILCDSLGISSNSDLETIKKSAKDVKSKFFLLNSIQDQLNIPLNMSQEQPENILLAIQKLKDKYSENNRYISKMLRILGVFNSNYSSFDSSQNEESPANLLLNEIQKIKEENEVLKTNVDNFTYQQNELCQMLDIDTSNEKDSYTLHFRMKGAIKNIENSLREGMAEFATILSPNCGQSFDTPQIVKSAITELQQLANKLQKELNESDQKLKEVTNQLQNFEAKNDKFVRKLNCSTIEEISQNIEDLLAITCSPNLDVLKRAVRQMKEQNKSLQTETEELNSKSQSLIICNQNLNDQLLAIQDQFACLKSKLNESEAKKIAYKDELKEMKSKLNSLKIECKSVSIERNNLRGQLTDKDEEILKIKEILQTEKGNVKIQFDEMEDQILTLKGQIRKVQQEAEMAKSDYRTLENSHNSLQQQHKVLKDEKQALEFEFEKSKSQIRTLTQEVSSKKDDLETVKTANEGQKQKIQSCLKQIDELENDQMALKRKITEMGSQIESVQNEKAKILSQFENEVNENNSLKQKIEQNRLAMNQLELSNSQQKMEIDNLNQMKNDLLAKNGDFQRQLSQCQMKENESEQTIQNLNNKIDHFQTEKESFQSQVTSLKAEIESLKSENSKLTKEIDSIKLDNESKSKRLENEIQNLNGQLDEVKQTHSKLKNKLNKHENLSSSFNCENIDEFESKVNQLAQNQEKICQLLGINSNSSFSSISDSISELLKDNKKMFQENSTMKQQLSKVASLLNVDEPTDFNSIQKTINNLYDEIQQFEIENEKLNAEFNSIQKANSKMCQILNVMNTESLIDSISSVQSTINQIKQILNVSDDHIIDCIESLHESIQTLCEALNIDPKDSWIDSVLMMYESLQDAAELLDITNSDQLSKAIQNILNERNHLSTEINKNLDVIQRWKKSGRNQSILFKSHQNNLLDMIDEIHQFNPEQLLSDVTDLISQNNEFSEKIERIFSLFGIKSSQIGSNPIDQIKDIVDRYNNDIHKLKEHLKSLQKKNDEIQLNFDRMTISLKESQHHTSSLNQQVEELQKQNEQFFQQTEEFQHQNEDLNQQLGELNIQNGDLNNKVEILQYKVDNLSQINEDLKQQNNSFEMESQNNVMLEKQISDICRLLHIKPLINENISNSIAEAIESLKKTKEEFINFKWKVNRLLKSKKNESLILDSNSEDDENYNNKITAETLREIETLNQLAFNLCRLFNLDSPDLLLETAKKQMTIIHLISPLFDSFNKNEEEEDDPNKWQQIVQEIKQAKQLNDKIASLLNINNSSEIINSIKNIQSQLSQLQSKDESNSQFSDQLCEVLGVDSKKDENRNKNQQILQIVKEIKEVSMGSQKVFDQLATIFNCETDYVVDFAKLICQTVKNVASTLDIDLKNAGLFETIENAIKEMKEENDSFKNKFTEEKLFVCQFLNELNISNDQSDDLVREVITKLRDINSDLKEQNESLKNSQQDNEALVTELKDKISVYKANNTKLFEKFDLLSRLENDTDGNDNTDKSDSARMKEILEKIDELLQIKKEYQKSVKKNKELVTKIRSIEIENVRHANQIKQSKANINNIDDALKYMKNHEVQITKLRQIVEIPDSPFSVVIEKVSKIVDQLNSENTSNEKLRQEIKLSKERIHDFENNEVEYKKLINTQENKIDSLTTEVDQKNKKIDHLNSSLNKIFKSIGDGNVQSADLAIDLIEDQKRKMAELNKELFELRSAVTVDSAFDKMSTNEKKQLKLIKKKMIEQADNFNAFLAKLKIQLESRTQSKEEIIRILKDAEADNYRLLELLDPPLSSSSNNNPYHHIHIGNEYAMNPFVKQDVDIFRKKRRYLETADSNCSLYHKIASTEKELICQSKKIGIAERKGINFKGSERPITSNAISISVINAQRNKKEQTTLF